MRSMGTINFTKINFSMFELLHMIGKVDLLNKIVHTRNELKFPRIELKQRTPRNTVLPCNEEISNAMQRALRDALHNSKKFGMNSHENIITSFDTSLLTRIEDGKSTNTEPSTEHCTEREHAICDELWNDDNNDNDEQILEQIFGLETGEPLEITGENSNINPGDAGASIIPDAESTSQEIMAENANFIEIINSDGTVTRIRKSTFIWQLSENKGKLSSDRLKRVQQASKTQGTETKRKRKRTLNSPIFTEPNQEEQILYKATDIEVGDWVLFKVNEKAVVNYQDLKDFLKKDCLVGLILGFKTVGANGHMIQYKYKQAKTPFHTDYNLNVRVLGAWYVCDESGVLIPVENEKKKIYIHEKLYVDNERSRNKKSWKFA